MVSLYENPRRGTHGRPDVTGSVVFLSKEVLSRVEPCTKEQQETRAQRGLAYVQEPEFSTIKKVVWKGRYSKTSMSVYVCFTPADVVKSSVMCGMRLLPC